MADFGPDILADVVAACEAGVEETAGAFGRTFDGDFTLKVGAGAEFNANELTGDFDSPGLVILLQVGDAAALVLLSDATGLVPEWCAAPDPTGQSKLTTLAQELGMLMLPEAFMPEEFQAAKVDHLGRAIDRAALAEAAATVPITLTAADGREGTLHLVWPATKPAEVFAAPVQAPPAEEANRSAAPPVAAEEKPTRQSKSALTSEQLPSYARSLLRIRVPLMVNLASKRQPIGRIVELETGAIIQFDKSCEELLELYLGNQKIALGEAVKVGEKFGIRITSLVLPDERFTPVRSA